MSFMAQVNKLKSAGGFTDVDNNKARQPYPFACEHNKT